MSWRRIAAAWAGPLLITGLVLFALRGFVFHDRLTNEHPDLLSFWLPRWTFLGRQVAAFHVPLWNPFEMAGYRFAADPQSGWLYAPPMLLFSVLSADVAMRAMVALNPLLAGLGLYAFLRRDGLGRVGATAGGMSLAGSMASSEIAIAMPFAGALAWSTVTLLGAAGFRRSERWSGRIAWLALGAFGWSQIASAHLSHGLVIGSVLVAAYLVANEVASVRRRGARPWPAAGRSALFLLVLPLASLAILVPRLEFIGASSLGEGYAHLGVGVARVTGVQERPIQTEGVWAGWPLAAAATPGPYAGAVILLAVPAALRARRRRPLVVAFAVVLAGTSVLLLDAVLAAGWVRRALLSLPYGDVLLHNPGRLRYVAVLALPVLGAAGIQGLLEDPPPRHAALLWLGGGAGLWLGLPLLIGGEPARWLPAAVMTVPAVALLVIAAARPRWAPAVVGLLAVELVASAVLAGRWTGDEMRLGLEGGATPLAFQPLRAPEVDLAAFLRPTPFVSRIGTDRYLTWVTPDAAYEKGYLFAQEPWDWPALANERGTLFGLQDVLGYNPVQLPRYWAYVRATNDLPLYYNAAAIQRPDRGDVDLLGIRVLVVPEGVAPTVPGRVIATAQGYDLVRVRNAPPLVSAPTNVVVVGSTAEALGQARRAAFDPSRTVVLEERPQIASGGAPGSLRYAMTGAEHLRVTVDLPADAVVLVRIAYDPGWTATVDGQPAPVLPADGFLLGVPVGGGVHEVQLTYLDADVTTSVRWSAEVWGALLVALLVALGLEWRAATREPAERGSS